LTTKIRYRMASGDEDLAPRKAHADDAAFDVRASRDVIVSPQTAELVPTGLFLELPSGFEAQIRPRSGLAFKQSITMLNAPGTIDAGYRGEIQVPLYNAGTEPFRLQRGDRIAQMVIQRLPPVELVPVAELSDSERGDRGFGSTGTE